MFKRGDVVKLKSQIASDEQLQRDLGLSTLVVSEITSTPGVEVIDVPNPHDIFVSPPRDEYRGLDVSRYRVPAEAFELDNRRQFKVGDLVMFDPEYSVETIAYESELSVSDVLEMMNSSTPLVIAYCRECDRDWEQRRERVSFHNADNRPDWWWVWRGCLLRCIDFDIIDSECEASDYDIDSII